MMMEYTVRPIADSPEEDLHRAFIDAFQDYSVRIEMSYDEFRRMMRLLSVDLGLSMGAYEGDRFIGFVLIGHRGDDAYDAGTAVLPQYRRHGIGSALLESTIGNLRKNGIRRFMLECLSDNEKALRMYRGMGFVGKREFICYRGKAVSTERAERISLGIAVAKALELNPYRPSWQNSRESLSESAEGYCLDGAYAVIDQKSLRMHAFPDAGRGARLTKALSSDGLRAINVDSLDTTAGKALQEAGLGIYARQYEMELML